MAPIIHCVRHAQGYHNLTSANHAMRDPKLTSFGEGQCRALQASFPYHNRIDLIVASPLQRTLYTALLSFEETIAAQDLNIIALPELQETSDLPCDTGRDPSELARDFGSLPVDLQLLKPGWEEKTGKFAASKRALTDRAAEARKWLLNRPEKEIVVVTHGGFLHYLTEDWTDFSPLMGTGWLNTEFRSYSFNCEDAASPHLVETEASRQRRPSNEKPVVSGAAADHGSPAPTNTHNEAKARGHRPKRSLDLVHDLKAKLHLHHGKKLVDGSA